MTSLKLIIKSKLHKNKRQKHIAQLERELGITEGSVKEYNERAGFVVNVRNMDEIKRLCPSIRFESINKT